MYPDTSLLQESTKAIAHVFLLASEIKVFTSFDPKAYPYENGSRQVMSGKKLQQTVPLYPEWLHVETFRGFKLENYPFSQVYRASWLLRKCVQLQSEPIFEHMPHAILFSRRYREN